MRGAKLFLEAVHRHGVRRVFGIVGGEAQAIRFDEVPGLEFFLTRHEFAAGIMADVCSRLDGVPNMCYSTFGPGVTNLTTGVCSAALDRSPMLAVSAQIPRPERVFNQTHQCIDNVAVMGSMCKYARELDSVEEIPEVVTAALRAARAEVPGPVFISFPVDLMLEEIEDGRAMQLLDAMGSSEPGPLPSPNPTEIAWLSEQLLQARRPIALGGNVLFREKAWPELLTFLERYQIPLVTTLASKGLIPDDHPLHIGPCNKYLDGILHHPALDDVFKTADLMLLIGYDFGEDVKPSQWKRSDSIRTLSIGPNPNPMGDVFRPEREIIGSLKQALPMLSELAPKGRKLVEGERLESLRKRRSAAGETAIQSYPTIPVPAIVRTVRNQLGREGILCSDIGLHKQYAGLFSATDRPNTFLCSNGCGTFGFGLPAAMGAKLAHHDRRVAVICGDGGFHSTSQDLETAVRYHLPMVVVLLKDNSFGLIKYYQLTDKDSVCANSVDFGDVSFVKLAEANGWDAHFVTSRPMLEQRMSEAFERNRPTLLELPVRYQYKFDPPT